MGCTKLDILDADRILHLLMNESQSFDAWGDRMQSQTKCPRRTFDEGTADAARQDRKINFEKNIVAPPSYLYRGYTGHVTECIPDFAGMNVHVGHSNEETACGNRSNLETVNMNGRLYDPLVGRMLSVDNYVHEGAGTQGYNRYSYALNNPLKYTDPDGEQTMPMGNINANGTDFIESGNFNNAFGADRNSLLTIGTSRESFIEIRRGGKELGRNYIQDKNGKIVEVKIRYASRYIPIGGSESSFARGSTQMGPLASTSGARTSTNSVNPVSIMTQASSYLGSAYTVAGNLKAGKGYWLGNNFKYYTEPRFHGTHNVYTGSRVNAQWHSKVLKGGGTVLGVFNYYGIINQYSNDEISGQTASAEAVSTTISAFGGLKGVGWGVGWEAARLLTSRSWYRRNVRPVIQDVLGIERDEYPRP